MENNNPYLSSAAIPVATAVTVQHRLVTRGQGSIVVLASYVATAIAGGLFGIIGGPLGVFFGAILAGGVGLAVFGVAFIVQLVFRITNHVIYLAILCGGLTGLFSVFALGGGTLNEGSIRATLLLGPIAGVLGAFAAGCTAWSLMLQFDRKNQRAADLAE